MRAAVVILLAILTWPSRFSDPVDRLTRISQEVRSENTEPQTSSDKPRQVTSNCVELDRLSFMGALILQPLTTETVAGTELAEVLTSDEGARGIFKYLVECALPPDAVVTISGDSEVFEFFGDMDLGEGWQTGPCDEACQEWVSACLLARTNAYGIPVQIYLTGAKPGLGPLLPEDADTYFVREGAFYGNLFHSPGRQYACRGEGYDPLYMTFRACTLPGNLCGIQVVGPCGETDGNTGEKVEDFACIGEENGYFTGCHNRLDRPGTSDKPDKVWTRVITVYVRGSGFQGGIGVGCDVEKVEPPAPTPAGGVGHACQNDDDCLGECNFCDVSTYLGMCTAGCMDGLPEEESVACGAENATCLSISEGYGQCTNTCEPGVAGTCEPGQICTGYWISRTTPDTPGCVPFCSEDAHCPVGSYCNRRFGQCGPPEDNSYLKDGEPCILDAVGFGAPEVPCNGGCFRITDDPTQGICGSYINVAHTTQCPDDPEHVKPLVPVGEDEMGICLYRTCKTDADCTAPLKCKGWALGPKQCEWP
ncbi:MAG: hypothetical protein HUU55_09080 [Myxococcales bacterium]|nr:hypothetical protein [Myxococcales bacterium]